MALKIHVGMFIFLLNQEDSENILLIKTDQFNNKTCICELILGKSHVHVYFLVKSRGP